MLFDQKNFVDNPEFYEEHTLMAAQNLICDEMKKQGVSKTELADRLGKSKAAITRLLSDGRNLTLKSFGRILYALGVEMDYKTKSISGSMYARPERPVERAFPVYILKDSGQTEEGAVDDWSIAA